MELRLSKNIFLVFIIFYSCSQKHPDSLDNIQRGEWIKDYAFCNCMKMDYNDDISSNLFNEDPSLGILFDIGHVTQHEKIDSLTKIFLNEIDSRAGERHGDQNGKPVMLRCLEFRKSPQLDSLTNILMGK